MKTQKFLTRDCGGCSYYTKDYAVTRTYDRAGNVKSQTYPSGRTVNYSYDAAGRLNEFKGKLGGTPSDVFYAKDIRYNARGQMIREEFGVNPGGHHTALYHRMYYNRRGQMFDTRLGTDGSSAWDVEDPLVWRWENGTWNRGAIRLFYSASLNDYDSVNPSQPDNNGNIHRMEHFVPNALNGSGMITSWVMGSDAYTYDELNRLTQVTETPTGGSGPGFTQKFIYDRWGNRKIDTAATSNVGGGVTDIDFQVDTAKNRLLAPTDTGAPTDKMRYNAVGNLIWDEYSNPSNPSRDIGYDVQNRIGVVKNSSGIELARYLYDAEGRRVRRIVGGVETWLVYGVDGELIAEYAYNGAANSPQKEYGYRSGQLLMVWDALETGNRQLQWLVSDHLGSPRMVVDRGGELTGIRRRDFLPFGEELGAGIGIRSAALGYGGDSTRQKFTGYEHDDETGLDFAQARYYASVQGRFTSVDPLMASATVRNPQTWNRYAYVLNNPLALVDPDGMKEISVEDCRKDSKCIVVDVNVIYDKTANKGAGLTDKQKEKFNKQLLQHAKDTYGVANIALNATYKEAEFTRKGVSDASAVSASAINVVVTTDLRGFTREPGFSAVDKNTGYAFSVIDIDHRDAGDDLLSHEIGHHFAGNTTGAAGGIPIVGDFANVFADFSNDTNISLLRWYDYTGQAKGNGYYTEYSIAGASKLPSSRQVKVPFYDSARKFQQHLLNNVPRK